MATVDILPIAPHNGNSWYITNSPQNGNNWYITNSPSEWQHSIYYQQPPQNENNRHPTKSPRMATIVILATCLQNGNPWSPNNNVSWYLVMSSRQLSATLLPWQVDRRLAAVAIFTDSLIFTSVWRMARYQNVCMPLWLFPNSVLYDTQITT
jgi:hypothetical protein